MRWLISGWVVFLFSQATAQQKTFTLADTLRGSITPERKWWDVVFYDLHLAVLPNDSSIIGYNTILYKVLKKYNRMQIDLMLPLQIDSCIQDNEALPYERVGNAYFVKLSTPQTPGRLKKITVYYHGKPLVAKRPPWDGGFVWTKDAQGNTWIATACQGIGASSWYPNKDHQYDEPDSVGIHVTIPAALTDVSNGRLRNKKDNGDGTTTYDWFVGSPINNYDVALNIGKYTHFSDTLCGENGKLSLDYWVLPYNLDTAKKHFEMVKPMLKCFEYWMGPYPFYKDGYKLVETPYLGMEHQSAVAYGNHYKMGYLGSDRSLTGWGLKWDFIIIHESGHEWFGNNITTKDLADMWVHEGFTTYTETLYTECQDGKSAAEAYLQGQQHLIRNDKPIIAHYGVNEEGSTDMYDKAASMIHIIRQLIGNDTVFRKILRGLNRRFWHQTVTSRQIEQYISSMAGKDFSKIFDQYLRHAKPPIFEYKMEGPVLFYRWKAQVNNFDMPLKIRVGKGKYGFLYPTPTWKKIRLQTPAVFAVDPNFYVQTAVLPPTTAVPEKKN